MLLLRQLLLIICGLFMWLLLWMLHSRCHWSVCLFAYYRVYRVAQQEAGKIDKVLLLQNRETAAVRVLIATVIVGIILHFSCIQLFALYHVLYSI